MKNNFMNRLKLKTYNDENELFQSPDKTVQDGSRSFAFNATIGYQRYTFTRSNKQGLPEWTSRAFALNEHKLDKETAGIIQKNGTLSFTEIPSHVLVQRFPFTMTLVKSNKQNTTTNKQVTTNTKTSVHNGFLAVDIAHFNC